MLSILHGYGGMEPMPLEPVRDHIRIADDLEAPAGDLHVHDGWFSHRPGFFLGLLQESEKE